MPRPPRDPDDTNTYSRDGRVDPKSPLVSSKPRRRKRRNRPEPDPRLKAWAAGARKRVDAKHFPPDIMLEPAGHDEEFWTPSHSDDGLWHLQLADAFGTRSFAVIWTFLEQLQLLCGKTHWDDAAKQWRLNENEFSAMLAMINSLKPRNELEAAHAAQMVAVHLLTMKVTARAIRYEHDTKTAATAAKLAQTFTNQRQAFEQLRNPRKTARQSIKVTKELHQHVHYYDNRDAGRNSGQSDATAGAGEPANSAALPSPDEAGRVVPITGRLRKARVPDARG